MATPATPPIGLHDVAAELSISSVGLSLGDGRVRTLAGVASGPISLHDCLGKTSTMEATASGGGVAEDASGSHGFVLGVTLNGGTAPFSYAWSVTSTNGSGTTTWTSQTSSTPTLTLSPGVPFSAYSATAHCVVTDAHAATATSNTVSCTYTSP